MSNDCGATIEGNSFCSFRIKFAPGLSDIDLERILNYSVSYNDGLVTKTINRTIKGKGENYLSNHGGWTDITAYGNKINSSNSTLAAIFVQLKWNAMVPTNGTITGYNVYRSLTTDFTTPLATIADPTVRTFTDSGVTGGQTYYYLVRPIVDGYPSRVIQNTATVKVIAPPKNMTLIHQFMANKEMCDLLGESSDLNNNYRCAYNGPGSKSGFFDLGYNLLVDRYETGSDGTARPGQLPKLATQNGANILCTNQKETINGAVTSKLLLNRLEWTSAANWPATLTGITELEASAGGLDCNGTSAGLEATGGNTNCMSRFGVENAAGNAWEWVSERTYDGVGISQASQKIDPTNTLLDGVDFSSFSTGIWDSNFQCYYPLLNLPAKIDPLTGGCVEGSISTASKNFHEDYYWSANSGTAFGLAGGAAYSNQYSGVFSFAWVAYTFNGGAARCGIRVP